MTNTKKYKENGITGTKLHIMTDHTKITGPGRRLSLNPALSTAGNMGSIREA